MNKFVCFCLIFLIPVSVFPGEFSPAAGNPGSHAIENTHKKILGWAVDYMNYLPGENVDEQWQTSQESLGQAEGNSYNIVSLGKRGEITLVFAHPVKNSKGYDFAVFENSYSDTFLELAKVYVSTNGIDFAGFETISNTQNPVASFGNINPENINNFAGKYRQGFGTPFDLEELKSHKLVESGYIDLENINYIKIKDVPGDGSVKDSRGNPVYDPYPTAQSGGFDLDGVCSLDGVEFEQLEDNNDTKEGSSADSGFDDSGGCFISVVF
jgi:hypothetical protein